ncbi:tail fiber assembly protein [Enterobacter kobei]|nr:tail fiber assembly protein [Enterobacter kobei]
MEDYHSMIIHKNFQPYTPEVNETPELNIGYLISDEGADWYECQSEFSDATMKIGFDATGLIRTHAIDVSMLWPVGLSVTEVAMADLPEGFSGAGQWLFDGKAIIAREYTHEELVAQANIKKQKLMAAASSAIAPLQDAVDIAESTEEELTQLQAWKKYRVLLNRLDISTAPDIEWPDQPSMD